MAASGAADPVTNSSSPRRGSMSARTARFDSSLRAMREARLPGVTSKRYPASSLFASRLQLCSHQRSERSKVAAVLLLVSNHKKGRKQFKCVTKIKQQLGLGVLEKITQQFALTNRRVTVTVTSVPVVFLTQRSLLSSSPCCMLYVSPATQFRRRIILSCLVCWGVARVKRSAGPRRLGSLARTATTASANSE